MAAARNSLKVFGDLEEKLNATKSCHYCSHQGVCSAFANFKVHVEPMLFNQNTTLKAENLAKICDVYSYENKEPGPQK